jgi:Methane oxygenase PmoA
MRRFSSIALLLVPMLALPSSASTRTVNITVAAGKHDHTETPVSASVLLPFAFAKINMITFKDDKGRSVVAQLTGRALLAKRIHSPDDQMECEVHFLLPSLKAGESLKFTAALDSDKPEIAAPDVFSWQDTPGESSELRYKDKPVLRYMDHPLDESTKEKREETFKVYHHLFDLDGNRVTKGPGGLYTHHRGIFYGFREVTYDNGKKTDIWHCPKASQQHEKFLDTEAGPVLGRQRVLIAWHGEHKEIFAHEERELTIYAVPGGRLVEFASRLRPVKGTVHLDGDPQHSGFHFRADQGVAEDKNKVQTIYIRPDGVGKPDETRNWDPKTKQGPVNLPWNAMSFVLNDKRYTTAYLDRPDNPKEARYSERDYGRLGSYFVADATEEKPLEVRYRLWLQDGQMTVAEVAAKSADFADPPVVSDITVGTQSEK